MERRISPSIARAVTDPPPVQERQILRRLAQDDNGNGKEDLSEVHDGSERDTSAITTKAWKGRDTEINWKHDNTIAARNEKGDTSSSDLKGRQQSDLMAIRPEELLVGRDDALPVGGICGKSDWDCSMPAPPQPGKRPQALSHNNGEQFLPPTRRLAEDGASPTLAHQHETGLFRDDLVPVGRHDGSG